MLKIGVGDEKYIHGRSFQCQVLIVFRGEILTTLILTKVAYLKR
jgi:hypothetical protein